MKSVPAIIELLRSYRFPCGDEARMQDGIEQVLRSAGIIFQREYRLSRGPIDFYVPDWGLGIEAKVDGSRTQVWRQLLAYADETCIRSIALITSKPSHSAFRFQPLCGKQFYFVKAWGNL